MTSLNEFINNDKVKIKKLIMKNDAYDIKLLEMGFVIGKIVIIINKQFDNIICSINNNDRIWINDEMAGRILCERI